MLSNIKYYQMVYNSASHAKLPFSNTRVRPHVSRINPTGSGMGSVLLRTGGGGAGSSYSDMDDYIRTTGINPYTRSGVSQSKGEGLKSLSSKLEKLSVVPDKHRKKKIVMSF
jgi:hypothetical protein